MDGLYNHNNITNKNNSNIKCLNNLKMINKDNTILQYKINIINYLKLIISHQITISTSYQTISTIKTPYNNRPKPMNATPILPPQVLNLK